MHKDVSHRKTFLELILFYEAETLRDISRREDTIESVIYFFDFS